MSKRTDLHRRNFNRTDDPLSDAVLQTLNEELQCFLGIGTPIYTQWGHIASILLPSTFSSVEVSATRFARRRLRRRAFRVNRSIPSSLCLCARVILKCKSDKTQNNIKKITFSLKNAIHPTTFPLKHNYSDGYFRFSLVYE